MSFYIDFSPLLLNSPERLLKANLKEQSSALAGNPRTAGSYRETATHSIRESVAILTSSFVTS